MSFVGDLFGLNGGGNRGGAGMGYEATGPAQYQSDDAWKNSQNALAQQQAFVNATGAQGGLGNQSQVFGQQQALAGQLALNAAGGGPNPAQAQFQQNANQVAAQTAGLIGSQKGMSPALQARLIAQQGAGAGQAAAGQAATLQAQQQLAAQQALMNQQANMANLSTQQVGQQQNALNSFQQGALGQQQNVYGLSGSANAANSGVAKGVAQQQGSMFGGLMGGVASALPLLAAAHGGMVPNYADGGVIAPAAPYSPTGPASGPQSSAGKDLSGGMQQQAPASSGDDSLGGGIGALIQSIAGVAGNMACGGPVMGEAYAHQMKPVPGHASVRGDSPQNDTVPAKLSPGEVIIPRSVMQSKDPAGNAAKFVAAVMAKNGRKLG